MTVDDERTRIEQSNEVAGIVIDQFKRRFPGVHPVLDLRYGIADAIWEAGYRRPDEPIDDEPCSEELYSWDYFHVDAVDPYWMRCHLLGAHEEHENSETGAKWTTTP